MKKLFKASVFLAALGLFIFASQISCKKVTAQTSNTPPGSTAKILYTVYTGLPYRDSTERIVSGDTTATVVVQLASTLQTELYYCNEDGSSPTLIPIPTNLILNNGGSARLTPDGLTVIFQASTTQSGPASIYSMSLNGSNLKTIVNSSVSSYGGVNLLDAN